MGTCSFDPSDHVSLPPQSRYPVWSVSDHGPAPRSARCNDSKTFISKLGNITSRLTSYIFILIFYMIDFGGAAMCSIFVGHPGGICFTSIGKSSLDLMSDIVVADLTPLEWYGFFSAILSLILLLQC
jgi:hypothetical protein